MRFTDRVTVGDTKLTKEGYLVATARVARTGVQLYLADELGDVAAQAGFKSGDVAGVIGQALTEGMALDGHGHQRNPHLLDYKLQTAADAPRIEIAWIETPAVNGGPNGSKGVGEPPSVPTPGAIANAIARATGRRVHRLPMTPERVWEAGR